MTYVRHCIQSSLRDCNIFQTFPGTYVPGYCQSPLLHSPEAGVPGARFVRWGENPLRPHSRRQLNPQVASLNPISYGGFSSPIQCLRTPLRC